MNKVFGPRVVLVMGVILAAGQVSQIQLGRELVTLTVTHRAGL